MDEANMNDRNREKEVLDSQKIAAQRSELHQYHGSVMQTQQISYMPEMLPIDLSQLEVDPWLTVVSATENRVSTGSTIPDPHSIEEGGRTWQAYREGSYFLPNDASEQDRLDMQHSMFREMLNGKLFEAPLDTGLSDVKVLDIGTGTGIWAMEFAEENPTSFVIGTDLSQIQPVHASPSNCIFVREDVEDDWTFGPTEFDFVHLRMMFSCFNNARSVVQKVYDNLNPGGFMEYQDLGFPGIQGYDDSLKGTNLERWVDLFNNGALALGRDFAAAWNYKTWMLEAGFVDVVERRIAVPGGVWPADPKQKRLGRVLNADWGDVMEGLSMSMLGRGLNMGPEEVKKINALVLKDLKNAKIRWFSPFVVVYGRKPYPEKQTSA